MSRFLFGDDLGNIKSLRYQPDAATPEERAKIKTLLPAAAGDAGRVAAQKIAVFPGTSAESSLQVKLATALSNGALAMHSLSSADELETVCTWSEKRLKDNQFVGLAATSSSVFSCTSNGALRRATFSAESSSPTQEDKASLPTRLRDWRLSSDFQSFTYGGEEVEVSVWNTEQAFQPPPQSETPASTGKKRKRSEALFPGEVWRAKNVPNDNLNLRVPVRITSLSFLPSSGSRQIVAGTLGNDIRRYDIRAARKPVSDWKGIGKVGGIKTLQPGSNEHELFASDHGTNMYAVDLRNGQVLYGYQGIAGAITSIAPSPTAIASTSLDRYVRTHDAYAPASKAGSRLEGKGTVTSKTYANCIPTCIVWDGQDSSLDIAESDSSKADEPEDDVWDDMEEVSDDEEEERVAVKKRNVKS